MANEKKACPLAEEIKWKIGYLVFWAEKHRALWQIITTNKEGFYKQGIKAEPKGGSDKSEYIEIKNIILNYKRHHKWS